MRRRWPIDLLFGLALRPARTPRRSPGSGARRPQGNVNGDGYDDLGPPSGDVEPRPILSIGVGVSVGDLNHDGYADMAYSDSVPSVHVAYGPEPAAALGSGIACAALAAMRRRRTA